MLAASIDLFSSIAFFPEVLFKNSLSEGLFYICFSGDLILSPKSLNGLDIPF